MKDLGADVILDDRDMRAGPMFADWELIGVPHRIVIGDRGLKTGEVEYVCRRSLDKKEMLPVGEAAAIVNSRIVRRKRFQSFRPGPTSTPFCLSLQSGVFVSGRRCRFDKYQINGFILTFSVRSNPGLWKAPFRFHQ